MVVNRIDIIHAEMVKLLDYVDSICREKGLKYIMDGGSLIGTIRHNGFIPWDDDIDISMLKSDYLVLVDELKKRNKDKYFLFFDDFKYHCATFLAINSEYWQGWNVSKVPLLYPIKLDIRPINVIKNNSREIDKNYIYRNVANYIIFNECKDEYRTQVLQVIKDFGGKERFLEFYNTNYGLEKLSESTCMAYPYLKYAIDSVVPFDFFGGWIEHEFEKDKLGHNVYIPVNYDKVLTALYGDYMQLPPVTERNSYCQALYKINDTKKMSKLYKNYTFNNKKSLLYKIYVRLVMMFNSSLVK